MRGREGGGREREKKGGGIEVTILTLWENFGCVWKTGLMIRGEESGGEEAEMKEEREGEGRREGERKGREGGRERGRKGREDGEGEEGKGGEKSLIQAAC